MDSGPGPDRPDDLPQYPGEDTRLTTFKELAGWYAYGWAAEVFVICGIGSFIPITLEQLARDQGTLLTDRSRSCSTSGVNGRLPSIWTSKHPVHQRLQSPVHAEQCVFNFLGLDINTASFAMYTFSISVLVQAIIIISMSGAADHGAYRKSFLLFFAFTGATATMLFLAVIPRLYVASALLAIIANTCFGVSFVLLNSFLPILVRFHHSVRAIDPATTSDTFDATPPFQERQSIEDTVDLGAAEPTDSLLHPIRSRDSGFKDSGNVSPILQLSTKISSRGIGIGYLAAVIVQTLGIVIVILVSPLTSSTTLVLRIVLFFIGLWWLVFTIPAAFWLRPRPGPPLPYVGKEMQRRSWLGYFVYAWASLGRTVLRARRLKDVVIFLTAWFLLSDAIATVSGTAVLFAKVELHMKPAELALISLIGTLTGVIGAFSWTRLSRWLEINPTQTIIACICLFEIIPVYGLLGYVPALKEYGVFGLQQPWETYPLGAIFGFVIGGLSSYCRSVFGELIPRGNEAAFYALYAITDKGSSVFGPAIVGAITDRYGEIRPAFAFLAVLIFIPLPLMLLVDVERGRTEAAFLARELQSQPETNGRYGTTDDTDRLIGEASGN